MTEKDLEKYKLALGYTPSEYQTAIFDHIVHGTGNAVLDSYAGSGKTSTIIAAMKLVPNTKKCLFLAFNRSVAEELTKKLESHSNCSVKTVHGLGLSIIKKEFGDVSVNDYKYISYLRNNFSTMCGIELTDKRDIDDYISRIIELLEFVRQNLSQSKREITDIAQKYGITIIGDEVEVVHKLLKWGKQNVNEVDYTDMVWLPTELSINTKAFQYDYIFNDEAQDYSIAYVNLFRKCFKRATRFVSCGDMYQSINQFAGASEDAFNQMCEAINTKVFKLPISYRCDRNIVLEARTIVKDLQYRENAGLGLIKHESSIKDIKGTDMVLSRTNAPLFKLYGKLINNKIPCYIKGQDDNKDKLLSIINTYSYGDSLSKKFESDGLFPRLYDNMISERNRLVENGMDIFDANTSSSVSAKYDTISTLLTIANDCGTKTELVNKIETIFNKDEDGVCLSTIHKAKGLEADCVHILCRSTMPQKSAKTQSEIQQERNLIYVAITRAKHKLCYVSEKEFPPTRSYETEDDLETEFKYIEQKVCELYNKKPLSKMDNVEMAKFRLKTSTNIDSNSNKNKKMISKNVNTQKKTLINLFD